MFSWFAKLISNVAASSNNSMPLSDWYKISFDEDYIYRQASPPSKESWSDKIAWQKINRVCFLTTDFYSSDEIYVYTTERPESFVLPTEASGGGELFDEILRRKLFDPELAIKAATTTNKLFCCPESENGTLT